jgi:hypothetical protein
MAALTVAITRTKLLITKTPELKTKQKALLNYTRDKLKQ